MDQYISFEFKILFELNFFSSLDYYFAKSMGDAFNEDSPMVLASCALVSKALSEGHICVDIRRLSKTTMSVSEKSDDKIKFPDSADWIEALQNSPVVSAGIETPLVLDSRQRLYFARYYDFQNRLVCNIGERVSQKPLYMNGNIIDKMLSEIESGTDIHLLNQKKAVKNSLLNSFTVISGGPGTGKTFIISIIKKIAMSYALKLDLPPPKIICAAPTGKAASRMEKGSTIHAILKPLKNRPGFYHNRENPLQADMVIVDEASMIDISLVTRLLEAVPLTAKVIILGDKNQLSSVQAGSVFNDICKAGRLSAHIFFLKYNFRSKGKTGIENLSRAINNKNDKSVESILTSGKYPDVVFEPLTAGGMSAASVKKNIIKGYHSFFNADTVENALNRMDDFKILCAHNAGEFGTLQINHVCEKILRFDNNSAIDKKPFKKIIMVNTNDYKKGLYNGDTGICFEHAGDTGGSRAFFRDSDRNVKQYLTSGLPGSNTAFAITIHKSQGSEYKTVLVILPDRLSPVITRQLLYTGVTRAKNKVIIIGDLNIIKKAMESSVTRHSGLTEYLDTQLSLISPSSK